MTHVLIIESDADVRLRLETGLRRLKYRVSSAGGGQDGMRAVFSQRPDLVLLDLDLGDVDGLDVLRVLRTASTPVVAAVPVHDEQRAVTALRAGADDCVGKPFSLGLLDARLGALARRCRPRREVPAVRVGDLVVDPAAHVARMGGRTLRLRPKEFRLLVYLASREGRVISRRELLREVWDGAGGSSNRTLDVHLCLLRRQLGESASHPRYLHSFRGVGVKLHAPVP
ncbi:response regulator transcription factor [Streptomyces sp. NPDC098789]|uniref:response regulator transcription factor n=1 Tax=Streptomyces sp. NPDC098789 TaxID=3366098 RepID=UPI0037FD2500